MNSRRRPYRVMIAREYAGIHQGWVDLDKPKCSGTFASREAAEKAAGGWWGQTSAAYVVGPENEPEPV